MLTSNTSIWAALTPETNYPPLQGEVTVDVAIVGGGISGLTAAALLKRAGKTVAVLEKSRIAQGETGYTTAHLTEVVDTRFMTIAQDFGLDQAELVAQSGRAAIDRIELFTRELSTPSSFERVPAYLYTEHDADIPQLEKEYGICRQIKLAAEITNVVPPQFRAKAAIRFDRQARFHPREYLLALAQTIPGDGSHIFEQTHVRETNDGEPCEVIALNGKVTAKAVIVVTNSPIANRVFLLTKIAAYRTYALAARVRNADALRGGLFWDTADPYHYTRTQDIPGMGTLLIVGGEDHKTGTKVNTDLCHEDLERFTREHFDVESILYRWSGQVLEPVDGLPYIGLNSLSKHVYVATGFSGNGMTFGTLAGMMLSDAVLGHESPWEKLYEARRITPVASATEYVTENVDFPKYFIGDRLTPAQVDSLDDIPPGEGRIARVDGHKLAVYRDEHGELHAFSPVCPHLGCHVHFNRAETTWDCPCHGSRFKAVDGSVSNSPAIGSLKRVEVLAPQPADKG